jgi:hypothetical protein
LHLSSRGEGLSTTAAARSPMDIFGFCSPA